MCIKMIHNITTFKNVFQYQMAKFKNAKLKLLLHQPNIYNHEVGKLYNHQIGQSFCLTSSCEDILFCAFRLYMLS